MDPNEALKTCREAVGAIRKAPDLVAMEGEAETLADAFAGLDEWLVKGGFLPQGWMPPSVAPTGTQQFQDERTIYRLRDVVQRALLRDDQLEARYPTAERFQLETDRLAVLIARWLVQVQKEEAELIMRMMDSSVTQQFFSDRARQLATEPAMLIIPKEID